LSPGKSSIAFLTFNVLPAVTYSRKYDVLGSMAMQNHRDYCDRHGYTFISDVSIPGDRPVCWAKIPAIIEALESHEWVVWADSDTLVMHPDERLEPFLDDRYDLVVQSHDEFFRLLGIPLDVGLERMPINTGVFITRSSPWSTSLLEAAYRRTEYISQGEVWDGVGEQEAMIAVLRQTRAEKERIKYVTGLQNHPKLYRPGDLFVHFYGNHARHRIPLSQADEVLGRWQAANDAAVAFPGDRARFHWCCIQNRTDDAPVVCGDLDRYLYRPEDIL
jgi:hypothetical protein